MKTGPGYITPQNQMNYTGITGGKMCLIVIAKNSILFWHTLCEVLPLSHWYFSSLVCLCELQSFLLEFVRPVSLQIMTCLPEDLGLSGTPCSTYGLSGTALHSLHTCTQTPAYSRSQMHVCASCYWTSALLYDDPDLIFIIGILYECFFVCLFLGVFCMWTNP